LGGKGSDLRVVFLEKRWWQKFNNKNKKDGEKRS
jgi:hypothetical protein